MATQYIFVTGGVVSSLGKGIVASSLALLLKSRGYRVTIMKLDPYINIDPGTLNPYEHGECYVTSDGLEADLDLGHYERFTGITTTKSNNLTTGKIYQNVINKERAGEFLGKTVQIIPHITDEIKSNILNLGKNGEYDFVITEIGGTVGDIESTPFLEAERQLLHELGKDGISLHLTYVPYIKAAKELKTKPTQHSVKLLQQTGIQPDILVLRTEVDLPADLLKKVAGFCNVSYNSVIECKDATSIYQVPIVLHEWNLDNIVLEKFGIKSSKEPNLSEWRLFIEKFENSKIDVKIGLVGKYVELQDAYKSISESLMHAAVHSGYKLKLEYVNSEKTEDADLYKRLEGFDGVIIAPGFGKRGIEGKIKALKWCREHDVPTFGICLGMQCMVIEFARNVAGLEDANSSEMEKECVNPVIDMMEDQKNIKGLGGTMRLGQYPCRLEKGSIVEKAYGTDEIKERHRHRYELNNLYRKTLEEKGLRAVGVNPEHDLVEVVECEGKRWYLGTQYHPEYQSTVLHPNPLFISFVDAAIKYHNEKICL